MAYARIRGTEIVEVIHAETEIEATEYFRTHARKAGDQLVYLDLDEDETPRCGNQVVVDDDGVAVLMSRSVAIRREDLDRMAGLVHRRGIVEVNVQDD